ncbi:DUF1508 domain-containing protein [Microvirga aerilata]|jgi:uncharacterized protein YegP (UPF0339 family)|uniref:DUF1508 domain-containing protein n=1 Tax=Microvirga aerilata TaxID=670292 RepID=A0A936Z9K6_9HYPH|nr:DUF1508 domain-containing protein [Microvirga aerilata]MBL0405442.1 DUF1508 domain-containing protein [Microvirga aerilata]
MHFEIDKNSQGQYIWRLKSNNGRTFAVSGESYHNKADCEHAIGLVKSAVPDTLVKDLTTGAGILGGLYGLKKM